MTVAVSCNLSEGVILGVDSAVTVPGPGGIVKVYENAEKLFQLAEQPIGVAIYGLGAIGTRSIGSYLAEFEVRDPGGVVTGQSSLADVVEALRDFFFHAYMAVIAPAVEQAAGRPFDQIPPEEVPAIGLVVGGFSPGAYLSEVWGILIPRHNAPASVDQVRAQGSFGTNWFAMFEPIRRYVKGYDLGMINELAAYFEKAQGASPSAQQKAELQEIVAKYEYQVPFAAMPIQEGVEHTRFLVEIVINHHRYAVGAPVVGGKAQLGKVTYRGGKFQILES